MARNKLRARREDIVGNVSRGQRSWRVFEKDSPATAQKKVEAKPKPKAKPKAKAKKKSEK